MSRLDEVVAARGGRGWPTVGRAVIVFLVIATVWAMLTEFEEVAVAPAEVVPRGQVKVIQHLEGGIIERIEVREGDSVVAGQALVALGLGVLALNRDEQLVKRDALVLNRARLAAEAKAAPLAFPQDVAAARPALVRSETETYEARRLELESQIDSHREQVRQKEFKVAELLSKRRALESDLGRLREIVAISEGLLEEGLTSRLEHIVNLREVEKVEGELRTLGPTVTRTRAELQEAQERLREATLKFQREAFEELSKVELAIATIEEVLATATDQFGRAVIRSPIDGVVQSLRYHTIGGVVKPGDPIMHIVPSRESLVIEARLNPVDRGYVQVGQSAVVKISTYDFIRYGGLDGEVIQVSPDSLLSDDGAPYFRVVVRPERTYLGRTEGEFPISVGMPATVDIHTGSRSVADYLLRPVLKLRHEAFRER